MLPAQSTPTLPFNCSKNDIKHIRNSVKEDLPTSHKFASDYFLNTNKYENQALIIDCFYLRDSKCPA